MRVSARADYAIRATAELAAAEGSLTTEALAEAQAMPRKFLEGILTILRREGVVVSQRGLGGGYRLARPAEEISLAEIVRAVDGPLVFVRGERPSELSYDGAADDLLKVWVALRASVRGVLESVTVADLARGALPATITDLISDESAWENP
ncbi:Rrf2 family transcriptional regulator [Demequina sp. NBRC 110054]|uniref:RrF2 family transcriptional regulator n=1 Tax=Demequina sp. NBRC 110054 TaxID=1570343 RepID=UPI000A0153C5|nr:Rrf2 family transcriptional regulator [Demequina sp. NBRC 110054]